MKPEQPIDGKEYFEKELANLGAMTAVDKKILTILIALVVYLFTCQWHGFDMLYGFIGATILMFIPKIGIGEKKHIETIDMGTIIFCASCMGIGNVGAAVGIGPALSSVLLPYFGWFEFHCFCRHYIHCWGFSKHSDDAVSINYNFSSSTCTNCDGYGYNGVSNSLYIMYGWK